MITTFAYDAPSRRTRVKSPSGVAPVYACGPTNMRATLVNATGGITTCGHSILWET